jgi:hypothetical protein
MMLSRSLLLAFTLVLALGSCNRSGEKPQRAKPNVPATLQDALAIKLVPAVDGGTYAIDSLGGGIWYLREAKAERVIGLEGALIDSIVPAVDGRIYLHVVFDDQRSGVWFLKGTTLSKVEERSEVSLSTTPVPGPVMERWLWAVWQWERLQRTEAEGD